jgi:hypothetical protein
MDTEMKAPRGRGAWQEPVSARAVRPVHKAKPTAATTIEPIGARSAVPREHVVRMVIHLPEAGAAEQGRALAQEAMAGFAPRAGEPDRRAFVDVTINGRSNRSALPVSVVVGVEGSVTWLGRPDGDPVEHMRAMLLGAGYRVTVNEVRECVEPGCIASASVEWNRPALTPADWYSPLICGKHHYRTCSRCRSVYVLTSISAVGQAPSLRCDVCGLILVAWGGSKQWSAELVAREGALE